MYTVENDNNSLHIILIKFNFLWKKLIVYPLFIHSNPQAKIVFHIYAQFIPKNFPAYSPTKRGQWGHNVATLPSECRERKEKYPVPWGGIGGEASRVRGLPRGIDTFH
jgi:hypothetical protein